MDTIEATNTLANLKRYISGGGAVDRKATQAINMAIRALEVTADADTVSRKEVLDAVDTITKWSLLDRNGCHVGVGMKYRDVKETVKSLPSSPSRPHDISKAKFSCPICGAEMEVTVDEWDEGGAV